MGNSFPLLKRQLTQPGANKDMKKLGKQQKVVLMALLDGYELWKAPLGKWGSAFDPDNLNGQNYRLGWESLYSLLNQELIETKYPAKPTMSDLYGLTELGTKIASELKEKENKNEL
jgi:hypothetical protein